MMSCRLPAVAAAEEEEEERVKMFRVGVGGLRLWVFSFGHFTMNWVHYPSSRKDYSSKTHCLELEPMMPAQSNLYLISHYVLCP